MLTTTWIISSYLLTSKMPLNHMKEIILNTHMVYHWFTTKSMIHSVQMTVIEIPNLIHNQEASTKSELIRCSETPLLLTQSRMLITTMDMGTDSNSDCQRLISILRNSLFHLLTLQDQESLETLEDGLTTLDPMMTQLPQLLLFRVFLFLVLVLLEKSLVLLLRGLELRL